jgi:hypothetical protein
MMPTPRIAAEFTGHPTDAFLEGIPARDLTADELDALSEDRRMALLANAASDHAVYALHGRDLKAEAKEVAFGDAVAVSNDSTEFPAEVGAVTVQVAPVPPEAKPSSKEGKPS